jgi:hypothetical protein
MCDPPISRGGKVIEQKFRDRPLVSSTSKERAEQLFRQQREGNKALTEYQAMQEATRQLTAKLRAERLAREAVSAKQAPGKT